MYTCLLSQGFTRSFWFKLKTTEFGPSGEKALFYTGGRPAFQINYVHQEKVMNRYNYVICTDLSYITPFRSILSMNKIESGVLYCNAYSVQCMDEGQCLA